MLFGISSGVKLTIRKTKCVATLKLLSYCFKIKQTQWLIAQLVERSLSVMNNLGSTLNRSILIGTQEIVLN
jgi:hypothetical protein